MMIDSSTPVNETAFGAFGEFLDTPDYTADEWADHDAQVAAEIAAYEAEAMADYWDYEPSPYFGDYSEM